MKNRVELVENLLVHSLGDEAILLNLNNEKYYTLNGVGFRIWEILTSGKSVEETAQVLSGEYDIADDVLRQDIENFIQNLRDHDLIKVNNA